MCVMELTTALVVPALDIVERLCITVILSSDGEVTNVAGLAYLRLTTKQSRRLWLMQQHT